MPVVENEPTVPRQQREAIAAAEPVEPEFELGEDVSQLRHQERERVWASTKVEGREQLSARETMIK